MSLARIVDGTTVGTVAHAGLAEALAGGPGAVPAVRAAGPVPRHGPVGGPVRRVDQQVVLGRVTVYALVPCLLPLYWLLLKN